ncbi:hypothetical protein HK405_010964 [Cladochytrium tenue]|nr:hypothetical protein HK405_010964 [Cladochytrium tenue]
MACKKVGVQPSFRDVYGSGTASTTMAAHNESTFAEAAPQNHRWVRLQFFLDAVLRQMGRAAAARACCVSRAWAIAARPVLYARVKFQSVRPRTNHHDHMLVVGSEQRDLLEFLELAPGCPLSYVRDVQLSGLGAADAISIVAALARVKVELVRLRLEDTLVTTELVAVLAPLVGCVTHLEWAQTGHFANASNGSRMIMGNMRDLRTLTVNVGEPQTVDVLLEYFHAQPPLRELHLAGHLGNHGAELAQAVPETIETLGLEVRSGVPVGIFLSRLRKLRSLRLNIVNDKNVALSPPTTLPPIETLMLRDCNKGILATLAGVCTAVRSLHLEISAPHLRQLESGLGLKEALRFSGKPRFAKLQELRVLCADEELGNGRSRRYCIEEDQVQEIVSCCPNLNYLELRCYMRRALPLRQLERLRILTLRTDVMPDTNATMPHLSYLVNRPRKVNGGTEPPVGLKVLLLLSPMHDLDGNRRGVGDAAADAAARVLVDQSGGRIQVGIDLDPEF